MQPRLVTVVEVRMWVMRSVGLRLAAETVVPTVLFLWTCRARVCALMLLTVITLCLVRKFGRDPMDR